MSGSAMTICNASHIKYPHNSSSCHVVVPILEATTSTTNQHQENGMALQDGKSRAIPSGTSTANSANHLKANTRPQKSGLDWNNEFLVIYTEQDVLVLLHVATCCYPPDLQAPHTAHAGGACALQLVPGDSNNVTFMHTHTYKHTHTHTLTHTHTRTHTRTHTHTCVSVHMN